MPRRSKVLTAAQDKRLYLIQKQIDRKHLDIKKRNDSVKATKTTFNRRSKENAAECKEELRYRKKLLKNYLTSTQKERKKDWTRIKSLRGVMKKVKK